MANRYGNTHTSRAANSGSTGARSSDSYLTNRTDSQPPSAASSATRWFPPASRSSPHASRHACASTTIRRCEPRRPCATGASWSNSSGPSMFSPIRSSNTPTTSGSPGPRRCFPARMAEEISSSSSSRGCGTTTGSTPHRTHSSCAATSVSVITAAAASTNVPV